MASREFRLKGGERILAMIRHFSATEKVIFGLLVLALFVSTLIMVVRINNHFLVPVPANGGTLTEGVIGLPRLINPVIAVTDVDHDLSSLIYAGLLKYDQGVIVPDLAASYKVSEDNLTYTFTLRDDVYFHDGTPVTADDVEFTIQRIQDPAIQSPRRVDWKDTEVKKISSTVIEFTLKQPYAAFINNFTTGILPKHIWKDVDSTKFVLDQHNIEPIGAGPYKISAIYPDSKSVPTSYRLVPFSKYAGGMAHISNINIEFFPNEKTALDALRNGSIDSIASVSPKEASSIASSTPSASIQSTPLPRIFAVFLNQNNPLFANKEIRQALSMSVDKDSLVKDVLNGYGVPIDGPVPYGSFSGLSASTTAASKTASTTSSSKDAARQLLEKSNWAINANGMYQKMSKKETKTVKGGGRTTTTTVTTVAGQTFEFSIATADSPDLKQTAEFLKKEWEKIGAHVTIKVFEAGDLTQDIIRTRKYDALLFGEVVGKDLDLYAFWHSSQRNAPGLNLSMYVNAKTDKLLEDARKSPNNASRLSTYADIASLIKDDAPAVFLYSPNFIYIIPEKLKGVMLDHITAAWDRWNGIGSWYIDTDNVWKVFADDESQK
ncbi:MAG: family 5 extracellular solute-binding protein peptide/nickel transport system substrate-binding [Candidatus Taylorbacteria bacterium]|nr:family 5 extracellular solute-binding protein peptide/nickel transport system substrate-binding [Candidatus Taylorbacteria bacterium]